MKWPGRDYRRASAHLVRDEGVAGSNPATPTSFSTSTARTGNDMGNETPIALSFGASPALTSRRD
jgi:hypothetical protein